MAACDRLSSFLLFLLLVAAMQADVLHVEQEKERKQIHFTEAPYSTAASSPTDSLSAWISEASVSRPNVLFLVVDDLLPRLGCYGNDFMVTPNIDQLASKSVLFRRAYIQQALCGPSRTSFLTGRRPDSTRVFDLTTYWRDVAGNFTTLPQYFKQHGYVTQGVGKVFHPDNSGGDDDAKYSWSRQSYRGKQPISYEVRHESSIQPVDERLTGKLQDTSIADFAVDWLTNHSQSSSQPFFLAVGFHKPHLPFLFPRKFQDLYPLSGLNLATYRNKPPATADVVFSGNFELNMFRDIQKLNLSDTMVPLPDNYQRKLRQAYSAAISFADDLVGRVLQALQASGLADNTIISLHGDHGYHLGDNALWCKHTNFEAAVRIPLMLHVPGVTSLQSNFQHLDALAEVSSHLAESEDNGLITEELVEAVDLFPTLAELAALPIPQLCPEHNLHVDTCIEGTSLVPLLRRVISPSPSNRVVWKEVAFSQFVRQPSESGFDGNVTVMGYSVRTDQHRYAEWVRYDHANFQADFSQVLARELYEHSTDPGEFYNVADVTTHRDTVESLSQLLRSGWRATLQKYLNH